MNFRIITSSFVVSLALAATASAGSHAKVHSNTHAKNQATDARNQLRQKFLATKKNWSQRVATSTSPRKYPWKQNIVTTVFWIGERAGGHNPVPNRSSSWDAHWARNYGGFDDPNPAHRRNFHPVRFMPRQNPFYCALPYNDKARTGHRPEAPRVVPWFREAYQGPSVSTCKGRWVAIRKGDRVAYAQWEDAGPFRTDHWQYVFGSARPKPNLNKGAGLDVSPAVRDYLGLGPIDVTSWKFVDFKDVPRGPWALHGDNNTFVQIARRNAPTAVAENTGRRSVR